MRALPRPDLPPGAQRDLVGALHTLHHEAGWPSLRTLAAHAGCSHTTVSHVFSSPRLPTWGVLELLVEGMHGDVEEFRRLWVAASQPSQAAAGPAIAGRRQEIAVVRRHLERGAGLLLVTGEAGIGKTRLVTTAAATVAHGTFVAAGAGLPLSVQAPLLPVVDALRHAYDTDAGRWMGDALADCPVFVRGEVGRLLPEVHEGVQLDGREDGWAQQRLFAAVRSVLRALTHWRSLALSVEDLHWVDPSTLDLVEYLVAGGAGVPIVGTYRIEDPSVSAPAGEWLSRISRLPTVHSLELGPLSRDETADQLTLLRRRRPEESLVSRIHARSQGLPLFTEQLAAQADRTPGSSQPLPTLLAEVLDRRLAGLGDRARRIADALGVADRGLSHTVLLGATGLVPDELISGLQDLNAHRLLTDAGPDLARLRHPLLAEAIRRRMVAGEEAMAHRRLADALGRSPDSAAAEVAMHWQAAGVPDEELRWRVRAARESVVRFASVQSVEHWLRVLELWPRVSEQTAIADLRGLTRCRAYCEAMDALLNAGSFPPAVAIAREALRTLPDLEPTDRAELLRRAGSVTGFAGDLARGLALLDEAVREYDKGPPSNELVHALEDQGHLRRQNGLYAEAARSQRRAAECASRLGDALLTRRALAGKAWDEMVAGEVHQALADIEYAASLRPEEATPASDIMFSMLHTNLLLVGGASADDVVAAGQVGLTTTTGESDYGPLTLVRSNVGEALRLAGRLTEERSLIEPVTRGPVTPATWSVHLERALLDLFGGDTDAAAARLKDLQEARITVPAWRLSVGEAAARCHVAQHDPRAAMDALIDPLLKVLPIDDSRFAGPALTLAASAAADIADAASLPASAARRQRGQLADRLHSLRARARADPFAEGPAPADSAANAATWRAELARLAGAPTVDSWAAAASAWDRLTRPYEAAYCRWRAAQVALAAGQAITAQRLLRRAARDGRGNVPLLASLRRTAESAGSRARTQADAPITPAV